MNKFGGNYLSPISFFSDTYAKINFKDESFWYQEMSNWGEIAHQLNHSSNPPIDIYKTRKLSTEILISRDGLIAVEVPVEVKTDEEALISISHHINSFLGSIYYGGLIFLPIAQKNIAHVSLEEGKVAQTGLGGDMFLDTSMKRSMQRYQIPFHGSKPFIDFDCVGLNIYTQNDLIEAYELGKKIVSHPNFSSGSQLLSLDAIHGYIMHNWTHSLIMGWTFIEIMLNQLWGKEVLSQLKHGDIGRKDRLTDSRTYSASVMIEFLYFSSILDQTTYLHLNQLRKIRNDFIHEGIAIRESDVRIIFDDFKKLIEILTGITPNITNPGYAWTSGWVTD